MKAKEAGRNDLPLPVGRVTTMYWGIVTAQALTEGVDMANPQSMADTNVPVTPAEVNEN